MYNRRLRKAARSNTARTPPPPPTTPTAPSNEKAFSKAHWQPFLGESSRFVAFFDEEDDFSSSDEISSPTRTNSPWEDDLTHAVNLVATMFGYRDIKCDHVHFTRNFKLGRGYDQEVLYDARAAVGNTDQPIASAGDDESSPISRLYWHIDSSTHKQRFINDWDWTLDTTDAVGYLLRVLAVKGLSFDIESFFELLSITNRCKDPKLAGRRRSLLEVKAELDELYGYSHDDEGYVSA